MSIGFAVTWDYRCPFARNVHENILTGLAAGADWDVQFLAFSLSQGHADPEDVSVWDNPAQDTGLLALQAGVEVRDNFPDHFPAVHRALFSARHDQGRHLRNPEVVSKVLTDNGVDAAAVMNAIEAGEVLDRVRSDHEDYARSHSVWGVPTFIVGEHAAFVRLMTRSPSGADGNEAIRAIEHIVDMLGRWPALNEFKHTSVPA